MNNHGNNQKTDMSDANLIVLIGSLNYLLIRKEQRQLVMHFIGNA